MRFDVSHIAKLANITLSPTEKDKLEKQLTETAEYVEELSEVDTSSSTTTPQVTGLENVTREDNIEPSLTQEQALSNAKSTHNGFFKIKGIFQDE